jgi:ATP-dependent Lon protease
MTHSETDNIPLPQDSVPFESETGDEAESTQVLPILPIHAAVLFPNMLMPLVINGEMWVKLIDDAALANKMLAVFWQQEPQETEEPSEQSFDMQMLSQTGAIAQIARMSRMPDGTLQILLQGQTRARLGELVSSEPYPVAHVQPLEEPQEETTEIEALARTVLTTFQQIIHSSQALPDELASAAANVPTPAMLADMVAANLSLKPEQQQSVCDALDVVERLRLIIGYLEREREIMEIGQKAQVEMSKTQREYVLRQQLEAIKRELGETDDVAAEANELRRRMEEAGLPEEPRKEAEREIGRLERLPPGAADASVIRTYLDILLGLPWNKSTPDNFDLNAAREVLDEDHFDLDRIKERIIEYLAVRKLQHDQGIDRLRGPILCLVGPPGVGKTSLGQSIARALGREFVRVALGGVRDESEIRGFRRTYVGALPGRIIQGINRAGSNNPVIMLDEIDKLAISMQGDPAAALLELLDPAQNHAFVDRYLDVPFDMSRVLFIANGNRADTIPPALYDRMEVLELAGYTEAEKLAISRRYLVERQREEQGLANRELDITDAALQRLIRQYTRESGVRNLERQIGSIFRKMATRLATGQEIPTSIDAPDLDDLLEPPRFRQETLLGEDAVGVATGLAWTPVGGDVLFVETSVVPGNGQLILTGQLGDVMRESARAAMTYARARFEALDIDADFAQKSDVHIHVPAGAVPKDGPSAGITMASSLISALTQRKAHKQTAMTGEITLRGNVLPIGGVKEKVLAAQRVGVQTVLLPQENEHDLREVPAEVRDQIEIVLVSHMDEVLPHILYEHDTVSQ